MKIKALLVISTMFFSIQASALSCSSAVSIRQAAEQAVERAIRDNGFGSNEHRAAVGALATAEMNERMRCASTGIGGQ